MKTYEAPSVTVHGSVRRLTLSESCGERYDANYYQGNTANGQLLSGPAEFCIVKQ